MICPTRSALYRAWLAASYQAHVTDQRSAEFYAALDRIAEDRQRDEYQAALGAYREHRASCPVCRGELERR